jgi:hypothetical protein
MIYLDGLGVQKAKVEAISQVHQLIDVSQLWIFYAYIIITEGLWKVLIIQPNLNSTKTYWSEVHLGWTTRTCLLGIESHAFNNSHFEVTHPKMTIPITH